MNYSTLIYELSKKKSNNSNNSALNIDLGPFKRNTPLDLVELSELEVVRHYTLLSLKNYGVDQGLYPLGSCTMKYNPKVNEVVSNLDGFLNIHPLQSERSVQGCLEVLYNLDQCLKSLTGMDGFSLIPHAGAHGELVGLFIIKEYFRSLNINKTKVIVPVSAHGTNPATATLSGFDVVNINCLDDGTVDLESLKNALDSEVACVMLTNPSTLGIFEKDILKISKLVHDNNSLLYYDGANLNAILGLASPALMGFDVMHINLHKTFSTPHGGGGPGSGPVGVKSFLKPFLPNPVVIKENDQFKFLNSETSIGSISHFYGNFLVCIKAYSYILSLGKEHIKKVSELSVLNANYLRVKLKDYYKLPIDKVCMHEVVFDGLISNKAKTLDVAKRLLDYNYHPPTIYFPLVFHESLMIEPTETESKETLDQFIETMIKIANEDSEILKNSPTKTVITRVDEVKAARFPILKYKDLLK